jgi:hypothetical protein
MLKKIALVGIFALTSVFSLSNNATATSARVKTQGRISVPEAPVPQGLCPMMHC